MCSTVPLFQKVVLQSGTASSSSPVELSTRNEQYFKLLDFCGIDRQDEARLEKLRNVPVEKLVAGVQGIGVTSCFPTDDRDFFPVCPGYFNEPELFEKCDWVKEIIIAESLYEVLSLASF
jgi:carboxylesterase type B